MTHYLDAAVEAARAAGELLRHSFHQPLRVNSAEKHDIKLEIDVRAQTLITELLLKKFPEHALYGEEGIVGDQTSDHQWVVDPLDGTVNYLLRNSALLHLDRAPLQGRNYRRRNLRSDSRRNLDGAKGR